MMADEGLPELRHPFKESPSCFTDLAGRHRQIGITLAQFRKDAAEFGEPDIFEQVFGPSHPLQLCPQRLNQWLIGKSSFGLKGSSAQHYRSPHVGGPAQELLYQARLADTGLTLYCYHLHAPLPRAFIRRYERTELVLSPYQGRL